MKHGKLNIMIGAIGIVLASLGGFALGFTYNDLFRDGVYSIGLGRALLKAGHTHGQPLALYNLIFGLLIDRLALGDNMKKGASILAACGLLLPIGLLLRGSTGGAMTFAPIAMLGGLCFLASAVMLLVGIRKVAQ